MRTKIIYANVHSFDHVQKVRLQHDIFTGMVEHSSSMLQFREIFEPFRNGFRSLKQLVAFLQQDFTSPLKTPPAFFNTPPRIEHVRYLSLNLIDFQDEVVACCRTRGYGGEVGTEMSALGVRYAPVD